MSLPEWVAKRLLVRQKDDSLAPPGAGPALRLEQPNGSEMSVIARGAGFDLYFGKREIVNFAITNDSAIRLGLWLTWWWVRHTWFGVKLRIWWWAVSAAVGRRK